MTPTELWNIFYHAMKLWMPKETTDREVRITVDKLMQLSGEEFINATERHIKN